MPLQNGNGSGSSGNNPRGPRGEPEGATMVSTEMTENGKGNQQKPGEVTSV